MKRTIPSSLVASLVFTAAATASPSGADAVAQCRAAHAADQNGYVTCLEQALQSRDTPALAVTSPMATPAQEPPTAPAAAPGTTTATAAAGLGAEQVAAKRRVAGEAAPKTAIRIVSASYGAKGLGTFRMEDGQVWRETERTPERNRIAPDRQYTGRIVRGAVGGYRMYLDGVKWMYKVERVQ